jgi:hypothetical protein
MNDFTKERITTYDELKMEEARLKELLRVKRTRIQTDLKDLKAELKPLITIAKVIGQVTSQETQKHVAIQAGTNVTIDYIAKKLFPNAGFFLSVLLPKIIKNYSSHYVDKAVDKAAPALRKLGNKLTASAHKV